MHWDILHNGLTIIQRIISIFGILIIISGVLHAVYLYFHLLLAVDTVSRGEKINEIRLRLGQILILGLEFIVAADLISTISAPDYYTIGIVAIVVAIRTLLNFSLIREVKELTKNKS
jgi:uncharacterized membrane protein